MLDDFDVTRPLYQRVIDHVRETLNARVPRRTTLYVESLDRFRATSAERRRQIEARITEAYASEPVDLLLATNDASLAFAQQLRASWHRDIPIIGVLNKSRDLRPDAVRPVIPNGALARLSDMNAATARNLRALIPALSEVLIIGPSDNDVRGAAEAMRPILGPSVRLDPLVSPDLEDLPSRFAGLDANAAIVYLDVGRDASGRSWQMREYLRRLVELAPRPVFAWLDSYLGTGIVGGAILDGATIGDALGTLAADVLNGTDPSQLTPLVIDQIRFVYDWEPLERFGIPLDRLPAGATVLNRPLPIWESYPRTTIVVSAISLLLLLGIVNLAYSRRRSREADAARLAESRRLVQAQDEERVRIARDLHDDLCHEMTMLALDVTSTAAERPQGGAIAERLYHLVDRTRHIAVGLHATHVGRMPLPDALAVHAANLQQRTGLDIRLETTAWDTDPAPPVALALYRGVQEALQNAVRHADATQVTITLATAGGTVRIEVTDDGIGFDPAQRGTPGLGMTSMRERMATVGGQCSVRSAPFAGTTIVLDAPSEVAVA